MTFVLSVRKFKSRNHYQLVQLACDVEAKLTDCNNSSQNIEFQVKVRYNAFGDYSPNS